MAQVTNFKDRLADYAGSLAETDDDDLQQYVLDCCLEVIKTEPGFKGNTATGASKPATVETGFELNVPLFINEEERIKIDTRSGEYVERAKNN